ncbi:hypothetical protein AMECASPLE_009138 [Ameca splendens]|uniref:Uncharacterized protein n=1 Tax=Ameca splendens TaxID=208324 RepID=A0ABV0ZLX9_9TELE
MAPGGRKNRSDVLSNKRGDCAILPRHHFLFFLFLFGSYEDMLIPTGYLYTFTVEAACKIINCFLLKLRNEHTEVIQELDNENSSSCLLSGHTTASNEAKDAQKTDFTNQGCQSSIAHKSIRCPGTFSHFITLQPKTIL